MLTFSLPKTLSICLGTGNLSFNKGSTTSKNLIGCAVSRNMPTTFGFISICFFNPKYPTAPCGSAM